jgi:hypothetical protein
MSLNGAFMKIFASQKRSVNTDNSYFWDLVYSRRVLREQIWVLRALKLCILQWRDQISNDIAKRNTVFDLSKDGKNRVFTIKSSCIQCIAIRAKFLYDFVCFVKQWRFSFIKVMLGKINSDKTENLSHRFY